MKDIEKNRIYNRDYQKKYRKNYPLREKRSKLKYKYDVTLDEYNLFLKKQNGICAICKSSKATCVDHNHITKKVRGLLCIRCNTGIGMLQDNLKFLSNAISYLKNI